MNAHSREREAARETGTTRADSNEGTETEKEIHRKMHFFSRKNKKKAATLLTEEDRIKVKERLLEGFRRSPTVETKPSNGTINGCGTDASDVGGGSSGENTVRTATKAGAGAEVLQPARIVLGKR